MDINMTGVFLGTKHAVPAMRDTGGGSIINISSTAGLVGSARGSAYGASKGGVRLFTKYTAIQHAPDGIRANSIHPGPIDTEMIADNISTPEGRAESEARIPLGRIGLGDGRRIRRAVPGVRRIVVRDRVRACHRRRHHGSVIVLVHPAGVHRRIRS